ncbi:MAG: cytochrome C551 [Clostridium sp.]|nr:cytochrome C551 [Clostridium sp.]
MDCIKIKREQEFFKEKGFENDPIRCLACRRAKKEQQNKR